MLVENAAVELAEHECKADADTRKLRCARAAIRRAELDEEYIASFAARVRELYPNCPIGREKVIAEHACRKYSGASVEAQRPKSWIKKQFVSQSLPMFATKKQTTTNCS